MYFEQTTIAPNRAGNVEKEFTQLAIGLFQNCFLNKWHPEITYPEINVCMHVASHDRGTLFMEMLEHPCYFRVGYCPVVLEAGYALATTFLRVGFRDTREHALLEALPRSKERDRLMAIAEQERLGNALDTDQHELRVWFHLNGIPQVMAMDHVVFADEPVGGMLSSPYAKTIDARDQIRKSIPWLSSRMAPKTAREAAHR